MKFKILIDEAKLVSNGFLDISRERIIEDKSLIIQIIEYFEAGNTSLKKYSELSNSIYRTLDILLQSRIKSIKLNRNTQFLVVLMLFTVAFLVSIITYRYITRQITSITKVFEKIDMGDFKARSEIFSGDELGVMAVSLNNMLDRTLSLIQLQGERDAIQESIMKLLDEVSDVSKGDLTVEADKRSSAKPLRLVRSPLTPFEQATFPSSFRFDSLDPAIL
jgi:twitching motility protein PilJ